MSKYKYNHDCPFEAFIINAGKYNEGKIVGVWLSFPNNDEFIQEALIKIGIGSIDEFGIPYEEWFIADYEIYVNGIKSSMLGIYANIKRLNILANLIDGMTDIEYFEYCKSLCSKENIKCIDDIIRHTNDFVCYHNIYI